MYCTRLVIDSFLKTVGLVLVGESNKRSIACVPRNHWRSKKMNVPIVDPDAVLGCKKVFVVVQKC